METNLNELKCLVILVKNMSNKEPKDSREIKGLEEPTKWSIEYIHVF